MQIKEGSRVAPRFRGVGTGWRRAAALLAVTLVWSGCEDLGPLGTTSIQGEVIDSVGNPIFGVRVGVVYEWNPLSAPGPALLAPETASLQSPYPNPSFGSLSIPVEADGSTLAQVEIRGTLSGGTGPVALVYNGTVTQDTLFTWDGRDNFNDHVPNGLYFVRLTSPPGSTEGSVEVPVILNRSSAQLASQEIFNALSGPEGTFVIDDIAVEQRFAATDQTGKSLGNAVTAARVILAFRDPDYQPRDIPVTIGRGETVETSTRLTALLSPLPSFE